MSGPYVLESGADLDRLRWYRAERPDVLIGEGEFGTWVAIIPEENGETIAVRHNRARPAGQARHASGERVKTPDRRAYVRLAGLLRDQITPGEPLPTIGELRQKHGHSWQTVGKALRILEGEGLIYRVPGLGYYAAVPD